ncbi:type I toxin-antitoxin system Ibs family toxin [Escherichia coli]|nr:type I toxin-antitoxin system Ibs family toxin [Escherichia coli]
MMKLVIIVVLLVISYHTKTTKAGETPLYPHS